MQYRQAHVGVVVRKDGTVPFDDGVHPAVKAEIIRHLNAKGHTLTHHPEGHITIHNFDPENPNV